MKIIRKRKVIFDNTCPFTGRGKTVWDPAIGECENCGRHVELSGFTNTCDCGADYNSAGQRLASRSQWGEETGEHLSDILRIK